MDNETSLGIITAKVIGMSDNNKSYRLIDVNHPKVILNLKADLADELVVAMNDGSETLGIEDGKVYDFFGSVDEAITADNGNKVYMLNVIDVKQGTMPKVDWANGPRMQLAANARVKVLGADTTEANATPAPSQAPDVCAESAI